MRRPFRFLLFLLTLLAGAAAQTSAQTLTTVTVTITDVNGIPYSGARMSIALNSPGGPSPNLTPCPGHNGCLVSSPGLVSLSPTGTYTVNLWADASILPAGTTYSFLISTPGTPLPLGTGAQVCSLTGITIAGSTQTLNDSACPALSNIGGVAGTATAPLGAALNIKAAPFNAVGDVQQVTDGVQTATALTSATANFKPTDVGKIIFGNSSGAVAFTQTTIAAYVSATQVTLSAGTGSTSGVVVDWGTQDDTSAFLAAVAAANSSGGNNVGQTPYSSPYAKTIYMPPGGYFVSAPPLNLLVGGGTNQGVSVIGDSAGTTTIFPTQTFSQGALGGNQGFIVNGYGEGNKFSNFTINGSALSYTNTGSTSVFTMSCGTCVMDHVQIYNFGLAGQGAMLSVGGNGVTISNSRFQQAPTAVNNVIACQFNGASQTLFINSLCSNTGTSLSVSGEQGASVGQVVTFVASVMDECTGSFFSGCSNIGTSKDVNFLGSVVWAGGTVGSYAMSIDGSSIVRVDNTFIGPYNANVNVGGVNIANGGQIIASSSQFGFNGTGHAVNGVAGALFQDVGGNKIVTCNAIPCTPAATTTFGTNGFTGGINPVASLTHTWNTCTLPVTFQATTVAAPICNQFLDQNLQLIHIKASSLVSTTCASAPVVTISDGVNSASLTLTSGASSWDSGAILTLPFSSGNTVTVINSLGTCATPPVGLAVTYNMQSIYNF